MHPREATRVFLKNSLVTFFAYTMFKVSAWFLKNPRRSYWEKCYFGVLLTLKCPLVGQPEFSWKIRLVTFFTYVMFKVCAKFQKNPRRGYWEKRNFGYFGVFLTLKHPLQSFPEKYVLLHSLLISCLKFMQNFKKKSKAWLLRKVLFWTNKLISESF